MIVQADAAALSLGRLYFAADIRHSQYELTRTRVQKTTPALFPT